MNGMKDYPVLAEQSLCGSTTTGIRDRLERQRNTLQEHLDRVNAAIDALDKQPSVAELLEKVMKVL